MTEETVGYVRLEWTCKQCGTVNPGPQKMCGGCGAPQAADQEFELPPQQELVQEQAEIQRAQGGPDVHCPYCGARNVADAKICTQCSGPLGDAVARQAGQVLGAAQSGPVPDVTCAACGAKNPGSATQCSQCGSALTRPKRPATPTRVGASQSSVRAGSISAALIGVIVLACVVVAGGAFLLTRTHAQVGVVRDVAWEHSISVEELGPVTHEAWRDQLPSGAKLGQCSRQFRRTSDSPVAGAEKVCGTPYVKNQGSGYGKQVQDCEYRVYDDMCDYTVDEWRTVRIEKAQGMDLSPTWPDPRLSPGQREGARSQQYQAAFLSNDKTYTYVTGDLNLFQSFKTGSSWTLKVNALGAIASVEKE